MKVIGIDSGTTLTKCAWEHIIVRTYSTAENRIEDIYEKAKADGVTHARVIGTGTVEHPFKELPRDADPLKEETMLQARGARYLTGLHRCLVVSVGTGVSYTRVNFVKSVRMPIGNSLGGGYLSGMRGVEPGLITWELFDRLALETKAPDLMVGDLFPDHPAKDLVLANFGTISSNKPNGTPRDGEVSAGAVSVVATSIAKDLILYSLLMKHVVFVGTAAQLQSLQKRLKQFEPLLKKTFHFPENGAFAGALGAMLAR